MNFMRNILLVYTLGVFGLVLGGGSMIKLYGDTCGASPLVPSSWFRSFMLMGSPWCRFLNWMGYLCTSVMEMFWYHLGTIVMGCVGTYLPNLNISSPKGKMDVCGMYDRGDVSKKVV